MRTCVGCGEEAAAAAQVRLVLAVQGAGSGPATGAGSATGTGTGDAATSPDAAAGASQEVAMDVVVDASGGSFGRGAHVHPRPACVAKAERGLARSFKRAVRAPAAALSAAIVDATARRAESLLVTANRMRRIEIGADAVLAKLAEGGAHLLVVATDAGSVATSHEVAAMVAKGRAVAWSSRAQLGALLGRGEVAIFAMTDDRLAAAFADAIHTMSVLSPSRSAGFATSGVSPGFVTVTEEPMQSVLAPSARAHLTEAEPQQWKGEACKSPEVR